MRLVASVCWNVVVCVQRAINASSLAGATLDPLFSVQYVPVLLRSSLGLRLASLTAAFHGDSVQGKHSTRLMVTSKCLLETVSYSRLSV